MQKSIVWSSRAEREYLSIIQYWNNRNQSTAYSEKLIREVQKKEKYVLKSSATLAATYNGELRRVLVFRHYSIIYKITENDIYVVSFWDNRQNPESLKL